ncbi:NAD(P)H-binding protein [Glycomyces algeriensis]|uniref:NAD(P)-dependent oxidoreductase n=1 Tax=Glycomyces algeriensis TaxID=256037 RepID=A0A9W6LI19_9ACTN|nr:NAD(P)H-binding protein [Glycomyces algeriensis]MDA1368252.1 NAD(P)H-binding protein [Glycomyces algeriensis]MDR7351892.1 NAD(P)H dehydrogenase (quinone) [Glycomyces algeriensis]GLI44622.1 NAD(P)-dependent oxidoreductase [Glycomyces algeriensis]
MIGITGATGGVGSGVIRHLRAAGRDDLVALARRPEALPPGVTARRADYDDPASLAEALRGLDTLVMVSSDGIAETMARHHRNVIAACAPDVHIVYTSIIDIAPDTRFYYAPGHRETEALLADRPHCLARTGVFADFFADTWLETATATGELVLPLGDGAPGTSFVAREDVSRALAAAATARLEGVVDLTGPEALTGDQIAAAVTAALGKPLRYQPIDDADYRARLAADGEPEWLIEAYASMFRSVREARFATAPGDVERLTGTPPMTFAEYLRR